MDNIQKMAQQWALDKQQYDENLGLNLEAIKHIKLLKAEKAMASFWVINTFTALVGGLLASYLLYFIYANMANIPMLFAGVIVFIWSCFITVGAIVHLYMQLTLDYSKSVTQVQRQLNNINLSVLYYLRVSLMILPFYFAYVIIGFEIIFGVDIVQQGDVTWLIAQGICSVLLGLLAIYLYRQLSPKNIDKPFTKMLLKHCGNQAWQAANELRDLQDYPR